jgi:hypothetical protein
MAASKIERRQTMNHREAIRSQYHAALEMLRQAIIKCPEALWDNPADKNRFWHVAYHTLFYTHLYLQHTREQFKPWSGHREGYNSFRPHDQSKIGEPYTKEEVMAYLEVCWEQVKEKVAALDLDAEASGFHWLPFGKLELQLYNIRHISQHLGELMERLGAREHIDVDWVSKSTG